jgi:hypothetical protein
MIVALIKALQCWLEIKVIRAHWELENDIEYYMRRAEDEIAKARDSGDHGRADCIRQQLLRASGIQLPRRPDFGAPTGADTHGNNG